MLIAETIGSLAAMLTTAAFVPQVVRTVRTRSTADLSFWWLAIFSAGLFCWLVYGALIVSFPLIAANGITFALVLILFVLKIGHTFTRPRPPTDGS